MNNSGEFSSENAQALLSSSLQPNKMIRSRAIGKAQRILVTETDATNTDASPNNIQDIENRNPSSSGSSSSYFNSTCRPLASRPKNGCNSTAKNDELAEPTRSLTSSQLDFLTVSSTCNSVHPLESQDTLLCSWINDMLVSHNDLDCPTRAMNKLTFQMQSTLWRVYSCDESLQSTLKTVGDRFSKGVLKASHAEHVLKGVQEQANIRHALGCYNPIWLRLAAEIAVNQKMKFTPHENMKTAVDRFIKEHVMNDARLLAETYHGTRSSQYWVDLGSLVATRLLLIIAVLDKAIIKAPRNAPNLFVSGTGMASSTAILQHTIGVLLNEAEVARYLGRLGYKVSYMQAARQEIDFKVENLAVDLRDGLKLCKLVDRFVSTINKDQQHSSVFDAAKYPAQRRADRLFNVSLALDALNKAGMSFEGIFAGRQGTVSYLAATDIVDGDREATCGLIWKVMLQYYVPMLVDGHQLDIEIDHIKKHSSTTTTSAPIVLSSDLAIDAARARHCVSSLLQWMSAIAGMHSVRVNNFGDDVADGRVFCLLVHHYLGNSYIALNTVLKRSPGYSMHQCIDICRHNFEAVRRAIAKTQGKQATVTDGRVTALEGKVNVIVDHRVAVLYTAFLCHELIQVTREHRAAMIIQRKWRQRQLQQKPGSMREHLYRWISAAEVVQRNVIAWLMIRGLEEFSRDRKKLERGVLVLQSIWRSRAPRQEYLAQREAAVVVQTQWRAFSARREHFDRHVAPRIAQTVLVRYNTVTGKLCQSHADCAAVKIQSAWRAVLQRQQYQAARQELIACCKQQSIEIAKQRMVDLAKAMTAFSIRTSAALRIQTAWRCHSARLAYRKLLAEKEKRDRQRAEMEAQARLVIERCMLTHVSRQRFLTMRRAACTIQMAWRQVLHRRERAGTVIQKHVRAHFAVIEYQAKRKAAITIQKIFKMHLVCTEHPHSMQLRIIRRRLARAVAVAAPHASLGERTKSSIDALTAATRRNRLPPLVVLQELARLTEISFFSCDLMIKYDTVCALISAACHISRDKTQTESLCWAFKCIANICSCKEYTDSIFDACLKDASFSSMIGLLAHSRNREELFNAVITVVNRFSNHQLRAKKIIEHHPTLIDQLVGVVRLLKHKQSSANQYVSNLEARKGSDASAKQATRVLLGVNGQLAVMGCILNRLGVESEELIGVDALRGPEGKNMIVRSVLAEKTNKIC